MGLEALKLSPASLRAGGATWLVDEGIEISKVRFFGRWARLRSLERYIQVARAQQIILEIPTFTSQKLKEFLAKYIFLARLPAFLAHSILPENLLTASYIAAFGPSHAIAAARSGGRFSQPIQESGDQRWAFERRPISRSGMGRPEESSAFLQARSEVHQYAKRVVSERVLGAKEAAAEKNENVKSWMTWSREWLAWGLTRTKGKVLPVCLLVSLMILLLSRPLLYVVIARGLAMMIRVALRRSVGLIVIFLDALLDEAAANLEANLLAAPTAGVQRMQDPEIPHELRQRYSFGAIFMRLFCACIGALLGRFVFVPRYQALGAARGPPTHLDHLDS